MEGQSVPTGVKVISVLYYIGAVIGIVFGLLLLIGADFFMRTVSSNLPYLPLQGLLSGIFIALGIILIGLSVLNFFIGRGLWKGKNWARIFVIIFSALGVISGLYSIVMGSYLSVLGVVINLSIGGYLMFNAAVKYAFSSSA